MRSAPLGLPPAVVALAAAISLAACQTTPTAPPVLELPAATHAEVDVERWWTSFDDRALDALVEEALANNLDLRAAMARIDLARAGVLAASSNLQPRVNLGVDASRSRISEVASAPLAPGASATAEDYRVAVLASYEIDLWGRYRKATEAARQELLATEYARQTVRSAVSAEAARSYFGLLAADAQLRLLQATLKSRDETVELQQDLYRAGIIGEYDLQRGQAERAAVAADVALAHRAVASYESALTALLGRSPREVFAPAIEREVRPVDLLGVPTLPDGLPSDMLARRPDIRQAEAAIAAASLRIDAARAQYFPSLALTASYGSESAALANLFSGPAALWGIGASLLQPLIGLKAIEANVQAETARRESAVVAYTQTVQAAFRETRDALVASRTARDVLEAQGERAGKLQAALELAELRYRSGYSAYIDVLDAQRQLLQAQTLQIIAARDARFALIDFVKSIGGGWDYREAVVAR